MYQEIIEEIKSNLTDNNEENKKYLISQMITYSGHEYANEIKRELSTIMWEYLTDEEKEEFERFERENSPEQDLLNSVYENFDSNELDEAFKKLEDYYENWTKRYENENIIILSYRLKRNYFLNTKILIRN